MFSNFSDVASDSVDVYKDEFRELDDIVLENDMRDLICRQFGLCEQVYARLMECGMDIESMYLMKEDDMKEIFGTNMLGTRIKFRSRLSQWQQQKGKVNTTSTMSSIVSPTPRFSRIITSPARTSRYASTPNRSDVDQSTLYGLLQFSLKGQFIWKFYEENSKLLDEHRAALVSCIVDYYKDRSMAMTMADIVRYTEEIGVLFPTEEKRYYYSTRRKGLNPVGKLYDKAINARRKIRKPASAGNVNKNADNEFEKIVPSKNELEIKSWLAQNMKPWDEVLNKWQQTFRIRRADILKGENVLKNWPLFKNPISTNLIDVDFAELFPDSPKDMLDGWQFFRENIVQYLKEKVKDPDSKGMLENLNNDMTIDSKDCLIVLLLHAVIKPPFLSVPVSSTGGDNLNDSKKRKWKPTITDAQNATLMHCITMTDYQIKYERLKSEASEQNTTVQPLLVVIGEDLTNLESFYVLYDCILYKANSFIKSLDILFKTYYVMNFEFRLEAKYLFELIESYFFNIKKSSNPNVISLTNYFNGIKNS